MIRSIKINNGGPQKICCPDFWEEHGYGSSEVTIAVIDSGIDLNHPDLKENIVQGHNFVDKLKPNKPEDDLGHGTHCAGIAAADVNNSIGIAGVSGSSKIMPIKVLDDRGEAFLDDIAEGIIWASNNDADVISMSLGIDISIYDDLDINDLKPLEDACNLAWENDAVLVAAAGNSGKDASTTYPASYENVISVAACCQDTGKPWFSNYGKNSVDYIAPGVQIYSTMPTYHVTMNDEGFKQNYDFGSGTSASCPHVAGVVALVKSKKPSLTNQQIRDLLDETSDQCDHWDFDDEYTIEDDKEERHFYHSYFRVIDHSNLERKQIKEGVIDCSLTKPEDEFKSEDPELTVEVNKIVELDPIDYDLAIDNEPEWYYRLKRSEYYGSDLEIFNYNTDDGTQNGNWNSNRTWKPESTHILEHKADWKYSGITLDIKLMEYDTGLEGEEDDLADISGDYFGCNGDFFNYGGKNDNITDERCAQFQVSYDIIDDFWAQINNNEWTINNGWHVASGEYGPDDSTEDEDPLDDSTWAQNDAEFWFDISDNYNKEQYDPSIETPDQINIELEKNSDNYHIATFKIRNNGVKDPYQIARIPWFRTDVNVDWLRFPDRNDETMCMQLEGCIPAQDYWLVIMRIDTSNMEKGESYTGKITVSFYLDNLHGSMEPVDTKTITLKTTIKKQKSVTKSDYSPIRHNLLQLLQKNLLQRLGKRLPVIFSKENLDKLSNKFLI